MLEEVKRRLPAEVERDRAPLRVEDRRVRCEGGAARRADARRRAGAGEETRRLLDAGEDQRLSRREGEEAVQRADAEPLGRDVAVRDVLEEELVELRVGDHFPI